MSFKAVGNFNKVHKFSQVVALAQREKLW